MFLQLLQKNADYYPEANAIHYNDEYISHLSLLKEVENYAAKLIAAGVKAGDRICLIQQNSPNFIISFYAIATCRAIVIPLSPDLKEADLCIYLNETQTNYCIVDKSRINLINKVKEDLNQSLSIIEENLYKRDSSSTNDTYHRPKQHSFEEAHL